MSRNLGRYEIGVDCNGDCERKSSRLIEGRELAQIAGSRDRLFIDPDEKALKGIAKTIANGILDLGCDPPNTTTTTTTTITTTTAVTVATTEAVGSAANETTEKEEEEKDWTWLIIVIVVLLLLCLIALLIWYFARKDKEKIEEPFDPPAEVEMVDNQAFMGNIVTQESSSAEPVTARAVATPMTASMATNPMLPTIQTNPQNAVYDTAAQGENSSPLTYDMARNRADSVKQNATYDMAQTRSNDTPLTYDMARNRAD